MLHSAYQVAGSPRIIALGHHPVEGDTLRVDRLLVGSSVPDRPHRMIDSKTGVSITVMLPLHARTLADDRVFANITLEVLHEHGEDGEDGEGDG